MAIGLDIAVVRILLSAVFGGGMGMIMAFVYRHDDKAHAQATTGPGVFAADSNIKRSPVVFLVLLLGRLIVGTLAIPLLRAPATRSHYRWATLSAGRRSSISWCPTTPVRVRKACRSRGYCLFPC